VATDKNKQSTTIIATDNHGDNGILCPAVSVILSKCKFLRTK